MRRQEASGLAFAVSATPSRDTRRPVLHRDGVWLLHLRAFDRHPLEEAIDRHDAAAITICLTEHRQPIDCLGVGVDRRRLRLLLAPVRDEPPPSSLTSRLASARKALLMMPDRNQRRSLEISRKHLEQDVHHRRVSPVEDRVVNVSKLKEDRRPALRRCVLGEVACCRSLRPDLQRLAMQSLPPEERPKARRRRST